MKLRKKLVLNVISVFFCLLAATGATLIIKDTLTQRNPASVLPSIEVHYDDVLLHAKHSYMDSYTWRFLWRITAWQEQSPMFWKQLEPAQVMPDSPLDIGFTFKPASFEVLRAEGDSETFEEMLGHELKTPPKPGDYTYRVVASWGNNKKVCFYFKLRVVNFANEPLPDIVIQ